MGSLSSAQHSIVIGSLLGDGTLRLQHGKKNALFELNHSIRQEIYLRWKYHMLRPFVSTPPQVRTTNGKRVACRFTTCSLPIFTEYYYRYYGEGRKRIPDDLILDRLGLAVWFMDDGAISRTSYYLNTQQFGLGDQQKLMRFLWKQHRIVTTLNKDKIYHRIRVRTASAQRWRQLIEPLVLPWFRYKLTKEPVTTDPKGEVFLIQSLLEDNTPTPAIQSHAMALRLQRSAG